MASSFCATRSPWRVLFCSRCQDRFVTEEIFEVMKSFTSLPPSNFYLLDQEIVYTVPYTQLVHGNVTSSYQIVSDCHLTDTRCQKLQPYSHYRHFDLKTTAYPLNTIAGFTLHHEIIDNTPFLLRPESSFSDVEIHTRIRQVENLYEDDLWIWDFREIYLVPYTSHEHHDQYLYFKRPPRYQVTLFPPATLDVPRLLRFLEVALPTSLNQYAYSFA